MKQIDEKKDEKEIRNQLTEISARQWDYLTRENLSPKQTVAFVLSGHKNRMKLQNRVDT